MAKTIYRVEIPEFIVNNPEQAIIDGFTVLWERGGQPMAEAALEAVLEVVLK